MGKVVEVDHDFSLPIDPIGTMNQCARDGFPRYFKHIHSHCETIDLEIET